MKNGSMRLSMFAVMFVACNVVASEGSWEGPLLDIAIEKLVNNFSMEWIERQEDCALVLADFRNNDKDMITFAENFASDLHYNSKNKEPILLCPNKQHDRTIVQDYHWVKVKCYNSNDKDYPCPDNLRNAYYGPNKDKRFLKDSSLVLYLLHEKALTVVPRAGQKTALQNSKVKHQQELSFMLHNREGNDKSPVIIIVDDSLNGVLEGDSKDIKSQKRENLLQTFKENDVEEFLNCLYNQVEQEKKVPIDKKESFFTYNSLKFLAIPIVLVIGTYYYFKYCVMINVCMH